MKLLQALGIILFSISYSNSLLLAQGNDLVLKNGEIEIGGTLVLPEKDTKAPLVILISGSGAQDRDESVVGFKPFKIIADSLAKNGVPSFRYDDRGVGSSTGIFSEATLEIMVSDVNAIIKYFREASETKFDSFVLLGHSQGGMVGSKAASENDHVKGLILMASPIVPLKDVIDQQIVIMNNSMGKNDEEITKTLEFQKKVYEAVRTDTGWDELKVSFKELLNAELNKLSEVQRASIPDIDAFTELQFNQQIRGIRTPQMKSLIFYDAGEEIKALKIPILGLFGGKDTQVPLGQNGSRFDEICKKKKGQCTNTTFTEANHLFQKANTGLIMEYALLQKEFITGFTPSIVKWIESNF